MNDARRLDVMCCCQPDNVLGTAPADAPGVEIREFVTSDGQTGRAIAAHRSDALKIPGFEARGKKGGKKRPTRTWRETKRPRPRR